MWSHILPTLCSNGTPCSRVYISCHVVSHPSDSVFERHSLFSSLYFSPCGLTSFQLSVRMALLVLEFIFLAMWSHILPTLCSNGTPCSLVYISRHVVSHPSDSVFERYSLFSSLYFSPCGLSPSDSLFERYSLFSSLYFSPCGLTSFQLSVRMALLVLEFIFLAMWSHILPTLCSNGTPCSLVYISRHVVSHPSDSVFERYSLFSSLYFSPCGLSPSVPTPCSNNKSLFSSLYFSPRDLTSLRLCVRMALLVVKFMSFATWSRVLPTSRSNNV